MLVYYCYALPLSLRIGRGFYEDGIWADGGFMPYSHIGGLTWREDDKVTLVLMHRMRAFARQLVVPAAVLRRGAPPAARQDRRARHPFHRQVARPRAARRARRRVADTQRQECRPTRRVAQQRCRARRRRRSVPLPLPRRLSCSSARRRCAPAALPHLCGLSAASRLHTNVLVGTRRRCRPPESRQIHDIAPVSAFLPLRRPVPPCWLGS